MKHIDTIWIVHTAQHEQQQLWLKIAYFNDDDDNNNNKNNNENEIRK